jgi:hypothetical protein
VLPEKLVTHWLGQAAPTRIICPTHRASRRIPFVQHDRNRVLERQVRGLASSVLALLSVS